jgi:type IV pilus assembly protein PilQ
MKVKITMLVVVVILACVIQAQDVAQILSELKTKPVAESAIQPPVSPEPAEVVEPVPAVVVAVPVAVQPADVIEDVLETVAVSTEPSGGGTIKGGLISVSLKEVEINSVIRIFSTLSDANIIVPTLEAGAGAVKVDVNLKDVEWKPALQAILETQNLELYEKVPGSLVYSVRKKPADAPLLLNIKSFKLDYASVSNVHDMIRNMVPEKGKISVFPSRNTIVVQSTPENLLEIQTMITAVDLPRQQVFIEAKFLELTDSASKQLGIDWAMLGGENGGYGISGSSIGGSYDRNSTLTENRYTDISGRPYENAEIAAPTDPFKRPGSTDPDSSRVFGITPTTLDVGTTTKALGATLKADEFKLVLAALKEINGTKVVSNPKVIVANEETAQIYIGEKEPNIKQSTTQAQQADAVTTYNLDPDRPFFEYGIKLDVTPVINTSSNISVAITPSLSTKTGTKTVGNGGTINSFPVTQEKKIKTLFSLESGQTAAIGGLSKMGSGDVDRKIPVLGDIPLIGRLFSYSSKNNKQEETIIFVTVGLANPVNINMETGLPQDSKLAMRHDATAMADRQIETEKQKLLKQHESERAQEAVKKLQDAEQKRLQKQK